MKRHSFWLTLIGILFGLTAYGAVTSLLFFREETQYLFLAQLGLGPLHFALEACLAVLAGWACYTLVKLRPEAYTAGLLTLGLLAVNAVVMGVLMGSRLDLARRSYLASREARGRPLQPGDTELVERLMSVQGVWIATLGALALYLLGAFLLARGRDYLRPDR